MTLTAGLNETLIAIVLPDNAAVKTVTWSSSRTSVATVDQTGKVKGIKVGSATITARTTDGDITATCDVTVAAGTVGSETKGIEFSNKEFPKTQEVTVIASGSTVNIYKRDDSSWSRYLPTTTAVTENMGVFIKDRNVSLSSFVMGKYEVTQELYEAVMGTNPSYFKEASITSDETQVLRPVETVSWVNAVVFCNKLTQLVFGDTSECVYYSDSNFNNVYPVSSDGVIYMNRAKKGYRLPTDAEWEFAARGGDPSADAWSYSFAGVMTNQTASALFSQTNNDEKLNTVGWNRNNSNSVTHEVGLLEPNTLGLYDMCGNISEWGWDEYGDVVTSSTSLLNPLHPKQAQRNWVSTTKTRSLHGGIYGGVNTSDGRPKDCVVSSRAEAMCTYAGKISGFRVCRTID